ncbi:WGR domain-containing protein [Corallococcus aberystwythensis]|uniref:WGR domain-containing protein n=1 Tax=Corallococcus aberystwythensis TaxID=2316722 RepID=A0A3A8PKR3_9BACT|nr:WGR domain-containing protein [Corallococcus aberystwythensis]RKH56997.1 WGR domain-containing protein [Corallococcus aberystwythensis]
MPRYEFTEGSSSKFWEITLEGTTLTKRWGRIGTDGQEKVEEFDSKAEAKKAYDAQVREKERKGYTLAEGSKAGGDDDGGEATAESAVNPDLEAAILAKPDDVKGYLAYAEWLKGEGDPRAELILLQHSAMDVPAEQAARVLKQAEKYIEAHAAELLGDDLQEAVSEETLKLEWHLGFIREARVGQVDYDSTADVPEVLRKLLAHPSACFLRSLTIGMASFDGENEYHDVLAVLGKAKPSKALHDLFIGDFEYPDDTEISWTHVGNLQPLYRQFPELRELRVRGGEIELGQLDLPELRVFTVETGGLPLAAVKSIVKAKWPKLAALEVWFGSENYGAAGGVNDLQPLLDGEGVPELRELRLRNAEFTDALCEVLPRAKVLAQLDELDLSMGTMTDAGAQLLATNAKAFQHLKLLDVSENFLTKEGQKRVATAAPSVVSGNQREPYDEESRYAAVGE